MSEVYDERELEKEAEADSYDAELGEEDEEEQEESLDANSPGLPYEVYRWLAAPLGLSHLASQAEAQAAQVEEELLDAFESLEEGRAWLVEQARNMVVLDRQVVLVIKDFNNGKVLFKLEASSL